MSAQDRKNKIQPPPPLSNWLKPLPLVHTDTH